MMARAGRAGHFSWLLVASFLSTPLGYADDRLNLKKSILTLSATKAVPDPEAPWTIQNTDVSGFTGIVVGKNLVLAPASLVSRAVFIQAQSLDDLIKIPLKVVFADFEVNLAVLTPSEGQLEGEVSLPMGEELPQNQEIWIAGIENDRKLLRTSAKILEIGLREANPGGQQFLAYALGSQPGISCKGEPLISKGKLVGLCIGTSDTQIWAYTVGTLKHFLNDRLDQSSYRGFPALGMSLSSVKSPYQKKEMHWPKGVTGLRVTEIFENSPFYDEVKSDDILAEVDGFAIDNRGFTAHKVWGDTPMRYLVSQKYAQDSLKLTYYRHGQKHQIIKTLRRYNSQDQSIPGLSFEGDVPHLIIGGLVFRELGVDYLTSFGKDWNRYAPAELLYRFYFKNRPALTRQRDVLLSHVLPDAFNLGYDKETVLILEKVNGHKVANLDEVRLEASRNFVQRGGEKYIVLDFAKGIQMVLPLNGLSNAHQRIAKSYGVTQRESFLNLH